MMSATSLTHPGTDTSVTTVPCLFWLTLSPLLAVSKANSVDQNTQGQLLGMWTMTVLVTG